MKYLCKKHNGSLAYEDEWMCDICSTEDIDKCKCGGIARIFGEALITYIRCDICNEFLMGIDIHNIKQYWNNGERGCISRYKKP